MIGSDGLARAALARRHPTARAGLANSVSTQSKELSVRIQDTLIAIRRVAPKVDNGHLHYSILEPTGACSGVSPSRRAVIGIPTRGCSFARSQWGGCAVCGHVSSALWNRALSDDEIAKDFEFSLGRVLEHSPETICLYTSGSFLDDSELSRKARGRIVASISKLQTIKRIVIESLPQFITPRALDDILSTLRHSTLQIGIGVDSTDDFTREVLFQRTIPKRQFSKAISTCLARDIATTAYLVLGHPLLPPAAARADMAFSIEEAFALGFSHISVEPIALQPATLQHAFFAASLYDPPTIWDLVSVLNSVSRPVQQHLKNLTLGGQIFTPLPYATLTSCQDCLSQAMASLPFVGADFWSEFPISLPGECCVTKRELKIQEYQASHLLDLASRRLDELVQSPFWLTLSRANATP